jgi:peptidoglycan/LPS O-acetylase OafA/YrhL
MTASTDPKTGSPASSAPQLQVRTHFPELDGLRGIAVLLVLVGHLFLTAKLPVHLANLAGLGVMIFFILSGFLITHLLVQEKERSGRVSLSQFYCRRALRIYPAFYFFLLVVGLLMLVGWVTDVPWYSWGVSALFLRNIFGRGDTLTHLWTLALEQQFYFIWPLLFLLLRGQALIRATLGLIVLIIAWRTSAIFLQIWPYENGIYYVRPDFRFDSIFIGCWLALRKARTGIAIQTRSSGLKQLTLTVVLLGWTLLGSSEKAVQPFFLTVQMILATWLFATIVAAPPSSGSLLRNPWLALAGRYSYSIYLWQQIFLVTREPDWGLLRDSPWNLLASIGAGILSYHLIERPFLQLRRKKSPGAVKNPHD